MKRRKPNYKVAPKSKHQWGKSLVNDFDKLMGGKGSEGERKKRQSNEKA